MARARLRMAGVGRNATGDQPPPDPGPLASDFTVTSSAGGTNVPFSLGYAFKQGDVPSGQIATTADASSWQCAVKNAWPDGSAKFAILSGRKTLTAGVAATITLSAGSAAGGTALTTADLKTAMSGQTCSINCGSFGTVSWATTDFDSPFQTWVSGPVMSSWIYRKAVGSDAHLVGWIEVRLYAGGAVEVLPWIENGYLNVSSPDAKSATYSFTLGSTTRFGPTALTVLHHTRQPLVSGSLLSHWLGTDQTTWPKQNVNYMASTGLTIPMLASVQRNLPAFPSNGGISPSFTPYETFTPTNTMHSTNMGSAGGADSIGIQPGWESIALIDNSQLGYEQMLRESFRFGAHQIHYRDESTNRPIRFSQRSGFQLRFSDSLLNVSNGEDGGLTNTPVIAGGKGDDTNKWTRSHQPGSPVLAYLMSGRFWFMEECQHITAINFLSTPWTRNGTQYHKCEPVRSPTRMQMREAAWCFRNLVNAATVTPDDDALAAEYQASIDHNIDYYFNRYVAPYSTDGSVGMNIMGLIEHVGNGTTGGDQAWQYDFWTCAWAKAVSTRVGSTAVKRSNARAFFNWVSKSIVGRAGTTASSDYLYTSISTSHAVGGAEYSSLFPGSNDAVYPDWTGGTGPWWSSWGAYYDYNKTFQGYTGAKVDGVIYGGFSGDSTGWTTHAIAALRRCASLQAPGASAAMARLEASTDWSWWVTRSTGIWGGDTRPANAHDTLVLTVDDFLHIPAVGARKNVNTNTATSVDYDVGFTTPQKWWNGYLGNNSFVGMLSDYSGNVWAPNYGGAGALVCHGGGHGGNLGQIAYIFDFGTLKWKRAGAPLNIPPTISEWTYCGNYLTNAGGGTEQRDVDWLDYTYNGSKIKFADHEYVQNGYVPPSAGGGPMGSLYLPQSTYSQDPGVADPRTGIAYRWAPHLFDLATGVMTRASATTLGSWDPYSFTVSVLDSTRNRLWILRGPSSNYHDMTGGPPFTKTAHTLQKISGGTASWVPTNNTSWLYVAEADYMLAFSPARQNEGNPAVENGLMSVYVYNMASGVPVDVERNAAVGQYPIAHGGFIIGCTYVPASVVGGAGKIYLYEGFGDTFAYTLTPSSLNFSTCTWTWGRESFSGPTPPAKDTFNPLDAQRMAAQGKWRYVPALGCIAWHDGPVPSGVCFDGVTRNGTVQLWRPPGTPI